MTERRQFSPLPSPPFFRRDKLNWSADVAETGPRKRARALFRVLIPRISLLATSADRAFRGTNIAVKSSIQMTGVFAVGRCVTTSLILISLELMNCVIKKIKCPTSREAGTAILCQTHVAPIYQTELELEREGKGRRNLSRKPRKPRGTGADA